MDHNHIQVKDAMGAMHHMWTDLAARFRRRRLLRLFFKKILLDVTVPQPKPAIWSLERIRLENGHRVHWQPYIEPQFDSFDCLACEDAGVKEQVLSIDGVALFMCRACGSHQFKSCPDSTLALNAPKLAVDFYAHRDAPIGDLAFHAVSAMAGKPPGRLLDVGCAMGFTLDMAKRRGWTAHGVDPAALGRAGAERFGVTVFNTDFLELGDQGGASYDVVLCSKSLEVSSRPIDFVRALWARTAPGGRLYLNIFSAEALYESMSEAHLVSVIGLGNHFFIPSELGLRKLFSRAGCPPPRIRRQGLTMVAEIDQGHRFPWSRRRPLLAADENGLELEYLESVRRDATSPGALQLAANLRLVVNYGNGGAWDKILPVRQSLSDLVTEAVAAADQTMPEAAAEFAGRFPLGATLAVFFEAMSRLNSDGDPLGAAPLFDAAARLAQMGVAVSPEMFGAERDLVANARFHAALALLRAGRIQDARVKAKAIVDDPAAGAAWRSRAEAEIILAA